ncbi:MAG: IS1380 family transposase [Actinomycetota bacterium]|nr:IS1380 family transposase [Actinomycetota bacterium]
MQEVDAAVLDGLRHARAAARAQVWRLVEAPEEVVLDVDAALVEVHSENKESAASHFKGGYGFHPMFCFADHSGEALAGLLRPGNATANSGADQLAVVDMALAQLPPAHQAGHHGGDHAEAVVHRIVVRADTAGYVAAFAAGLVARNIEFSIGARVNDQLSAAIGAVPNDGWRRAIDREGEPRHRGEVAELEVSVEGWPVGTRAICRREEPHAGAQARLWDTDGFRHQVTLTNSAGDALDLELRHRLHARVENAIKALRDSGLDRMPFSRFAANQAWMELVLAGADLLAWLRSVALDGELAQAEPKTLRYRLLHAAARIVRRARQVVLRLPAHWPWAADLANAYRRVGLLGA